MSDWLIEMLLACFDGVMDLITLGYWSRWQGERRVRLYKEDE